MASFSYFSMSQVELETKFPLRSPYEEVRRVTEAANWDLKWLNGEYLQALEKVAGKPEQQRYILDGLMQMFLERIDTLHGRGDPIASLPTRILNDMEFILDTRKIYPELGYEVDKYYSDGSVAIALLTLPTQEDVKTYLGLISNQQQRHYHAELLIKSFCPEWQFTSEPAQKDSSVKWHNSNKLPLIKALMLDRDKQIPVVCKYLDKWEKNHKTSRPFGWKPWDEVLASGKIERGNSWHAFAFEVALTACAYDIDDSSFRDHPRYPRDLVDYYRKNIRHSRDASRKEGVGADVSIQLPQKMPKIDLSKSKSKSFRRWLELVTDGDEDAVQAAIDECGRIRKIKNIVKLADVLSLNDGVVFSDIKDDENLEASLINELKIRGLEGFEATDMVGGPGRCEQMLIDAKEWLFDKNYCLIRLPVDDWCAVLIRNDFKEEFLELSKTLGLRLS